MQGDRDNSGNVYHDVLTAISDVFAVVANTAYSITYYVNGLEATLSGAPTDYVSGIGISAATFADILPTVPSGQRFLGRFMSAEVGTLLTGIPATAEGDDLTLVSDVPTRRWGTEIRWIIWKSTDAGE